MKKSLLLAALLGASLAASAASRLERYALVLPDAPLAAQVTSRRELAGASIVDRRAAISHSQQSLRDQLQQRGIRITGSTQTILNAVYVAVSEDQVGELSRLPGVLSVHRLRPLKRTLNAALDLVNVPAAWNSIGGVGNAGTGVKIAILDTGIDQKHPGFQDSSLRPPAGFPKCNSTNGDCSYTNSKVIVARSYVQMLNYEFGTDPIDTRPDDNSPRDRVGHGTAAAMVAAGVQNTGPLATITGVAPKAFLGNYKIFGSPGVNDFTFPDVLIKALEDAVNDGMDIASVSLSQPALCGGPNNTKDLCGSDVDVQVPAVENAIKMGLTVVIGAGNDGDLGTTSPLGSINSPGTAPSAITVGASENRHILIQSVQASGSGVPSSLATVDAYFGTAPAPLGATSGPLRDAAAAGDEFACSALKANSLAGSIALIKRGNCAFATKVNGAQAAGAIGVIIYRDTGETPFRMPALQNTGIPAVLVGNKNGVALKAVAGTATVALNPAFRSVDNPDYDLIALFSSQGPSLGDNAIKPEIVAPGTNLYMATQTYDPNSELYDPSGYVAAQGTSFAAPLVAGAAALVKQKNPSFTPALIKSAIVDSAQSVSDVDASGKVIPAHIVAAGAGKLDAAAALKVQVTADPATISFGVVGTTLPSKTITLRNSSNASVNLQVSVKPSSTDSKAQVSVSPSSLTLAAGQASQVTVRLTGAQPAPGSYEGFVVVDGGGQSLRLPYLYLVGDGVAANVLPLLGYEFVRVSGGRLTLAFRVTDKYGVPVSGAPIVFRSTLGGGTIDVATGATDELGIGETVSANLGKVIGEQGFAADVGGLTVFFNGVTRDSPVIASGGVVNAASQTAGQGFAPGSYISIYGTALSDALVQARTPYLPVALSNVSVSFDVPAKSISVPGHLYFASTGQVNVQIPWELQGNSTASMKVSIGAYSTAVYQLALTDYSPAAFEYQDSGSGKTLAAALDANFKLISSANPVARGQVAQIYVNGLGSVDNAVPSGELSPGQPLSRTQALPTVSIAGQPAQVIFSGLAPGIVGLYQVNVVVPANAPTGIQPVVFTVNGVSSKATNLAIQ